MNAVFAPAYVGLGSNLDDPPARIRAALDALADLEQSRLIAVSSLWRGPPMGPQDQPEFVNAVAALLTLLEPEHLLERLQAVELAHGRRRGDVRWGPRTLDLDLLMHGEALRDTPSLVLPHPGIGSRPFVLLPLAEVAPALRIPGLGQVARLAAAVSAPGLVRLDA